MVFPPAVVWYEEHILAKAKDVYGNVIIDDNGNEKWKYPCCICWGRCKKKDDVDENGIKLAKLNPVERFYD